MDVELSDFQWQVLEVVASRPGDYVSAGTVARTLNMPQKDVLGTGTARALVILMEKKLVLQNEDFINRFCLSHAGRMALGARQKYLAQVLRAPDADVIGLDDVVLMPKNVHSKDTLKRMGTPNRYGKVIYVEDDGVLRIVDTHGKQHRFAPQWVKKCADVQMIWRDGRWIVLGEGASIQPPTPAVMSALAQPRRKVF